MTATRRWQNHFWYIIGKKIINWNFYANCYNINTIELSNYVRLICTINQSMCRTRFFFLSHTYTHRNFLNEVLLFKNHPTTKKENGAGEKTNFYHWHMTMNKIWNLITWMNHKMKEAEKKSEISFSCHVKTRQVMNQNLMTLAICLSFYFVCVSFKFLCPPLFYACVFLSILDCGSPYCKKLSWNSSHTRPDNHRTESTIYYKWQVL